MIGSGEAHVRTVVSIAQSQLQDGTPTPAITAFASLGNFGTNSSKEERDLHTWLKQRGACLQVYYFPLKLEVPWGNVF